MNRTIIPEKIVNSDEEEKQQITIYSKKGTETSNVIEVDNATVIEHSEEHTIITATEIERLFHELSITEKNDLTVNPTLPERIQQYLEYQKNLDPLRIQLAERIYKPFIIDYEIKDYKSFDLFINETRVGLYKFYSLDHFYRVISISTFRCLLACIGNPYFPYIKTSENVLIHLEAYVLFNNGTFKFKNEAFYITLK